MYINEEYKDGSKYVGLINEKGKRHGPGTYYYTNGDILDAIWEEDYPLSGTYTQPDGFKYIGKIAYNKEKLDLSGEGTSYYVNGDIYVGYHSDLIRSCKGTYYYKNGNIETGFWVNGELSEGKYILADGTTYKGRFYKENDNLIFSGTNFNYDGSYYIGRIVNFKYDGIGTLYYHKKKIEYEGEWKNGLKHGKGKFYWRNGDMYEGGWENGLKHGKGTLTSVGLIYTGTWVNDCREGKFTTKLPFRNEKVTQIYENDKLIEEVIKTKLDSNLIKETINLKDGSLYIGEVKNNKPNGIGILYPNKDNYKIYYSGTFRNGKLNGNGICELENYRYEGQFKNGKITGLGIMKHKEHNGQTIGYFKNGFPHGFSRLSNVISGITIIEGIYNGVSFKGNTKIIYEDKREYYGKVKRYYAHGKGRMDYPDGSTIIGKFKKKIPHGDAILIENNVKYESKYDNGVCIKKRKALIDIKKKY